MRFFFDRCVPVAIANMVKALEAGHDQIDYHDDHFGKATPDVDWIAAVARWSPRPVVISGDTRILVRPDEALALVEADLMFVCLSAGWTSMDFRECAWKFFKAWINIRDALSKAKDPAIFRVATGSGLKVERESLTRRLQTRKSGTPPPNR